MTFLRDKNLFFILNFFHFELVYPFYFRSISVKGIVEVGFINLTVSGPVLFVIYF